MIWKFLRRSWSKKRATSENDEWSVRGFDRVGVGVSVRGQYEGKVSGSTFTGVTMMQEVLQYLKTHGQRLDSEIAAATGIPLEQVRRDISALSTMGQITTCSVTRFNGDERFEGIQCRPATFIPPKSPGRKPGAQVKAAV